MLRIAGCLLVIAGTTGIAGCICGENRKHLELLKEILYIYENMKYFIAYQKATVPEACLRLSEKVDEPFRTSLCRIYEGMREGNLSFPRIWESSMEEYLKKTALKEKEKRLIKKFPDCLGYLEENAQARALDESIHEIKQWICELEEEQKSKNKVIISLGAASGIFIAILLL